MAARIPWSKIAPAGGGYRIALPSGSITLLTAADPCFSMRWTSTTNRCIIRSFRLKYSNNVVFTGAQLLEFGLYFARSFTVSDTGGTAATLTGNNCKLDTLFPTTQMGDMRISTTGTLTAGTRTLDTQPLGVSTSWKTTTLSSGSTDDEFQYVLLDTGDPITLRADEGLILAPIVTMGAGGAAKIWVEIEWAEPPVGLV